MIDRKLCVEIRAISNGFLLSGKRYSGRGNRDYEERFYGTEADVREAVGAIIAESFKAPAPRKDRLPRREPVCPFLRDDVLEPDEREACPICGLMPDGSGGPCTDSDMRAAAIEQFTASCDRSGEAIETATQIAGSTEGESAVTDAKRPADAQPNPESPND